jgi:hypothetical protein
LSYKNEKYTKTLSEIIGDFKKAANKIKTLAQLKKIKRNVFASFLASAILATTAIIIGFVPVIEYRGISYYNSNAEISYVSPSSDYAIAYEVVGIKGLLFKDHYKKTKVDIPETYRNKPVVSIGDFALSDYHLKSITIPETIIRIGEEALALNNLEEIVVPKSVKVIEKGAFSNNISLKTLISLVLIISFQSSRENILEFFLICSIVCFVS